MYLFKIHKSVCVFVCVCKAICNHVLYEKYLQTFYKIIIIAAAEECVRAENPSLEMVYSSVNAFYIENIGVVHTPLAIESFCDCSSISYM